MITRRIACTLAASLCALLSLAAAAEAKIVIGVGLAGVKLGDTPARVKAVLWPVLGHPDFIIGTTQHPATWYWFPHHATSGEALYSVDFNSNVVDVLFTTSTKERTNKGIGPGSTAKALHKAYPHLKCGRPYVGAAWQCLFVNHSHGREVDTHIDLLPNGKRVHSVDVNYLSG